MTDEPKLVIYLKGALSMAYGPKMMMIGESGRHYDFIWDDRRKQFIYAEAYLSDTEKLERVTGDYIDMVTGLKGASQYSAYVPSFKHEGLGIEEPAILASPPAELLCKQRGLSLSGMVAEGLFGNGVHGEIQVDDIEAFLNPHAPQ